MNCGGLGSKSCVHDVADFALLPRVVSVGVFRLWSWSHGPREARLPTTRSHPVAARQHHISRVSVSGKFHGNPCTVYSSGLAGKAFQRARYAGGGGEASPFSVP